MRRLLAIALLSGCAAQPIVRTEYQRVDVPVSVRAVPPPELSSDIPLSLKFISPTDPLASSALTVDGESALTALINEYVARLAAWRAWAAE